MGETAKRAARIFARLESSADGDEPRGALYIYDAIGIDWFGEGVGAKHVVAKLDELKKAGARHLDVHLNSPGGDVFEGMAIYNCVKSWAGGGEKRVYVDGLAASMASIVAMAGDKVVMSPVSMMMIHNPRGFAVGESVDMRKMAEMLDGIRDVMIAAYSAKSKLSAKKIGELCDAETWMSADEAVENGFADEVSDEKSDDDQDGDDDDDDGVMDLAGIAAKIFTKAPPPAAAAAMSKRLNFHTTAVAIGAALKEKEMTDAEKKLHEDEIAKITQRAEASEKAQAELLAITGKATLGEAHAFVAGLKEKSAKVDELTALTLKLESEKRDVEIKAMLDEASKDGKLQPAKRAELEAKTGPAFMKDPVQLKAFLDCLPKVVATITEDVKPPKEEIGTAVLNDEEKRMAAKYRISEEHMAVMKAGGSAALDKRLAEEKLKK